MLRKKRKVLNKLETRNIKETRNKSMKAKVKSRKEIKKD